MSTRAKSKRRKLTAKKIKTAVQIEVLAAKLKAKRVSRMTHELMAQMLGDVKDYLEEEGTTSIPYHQMAVLADVADDIVSILNKKMSNSSDEETE